MEKELNHERGLFITFEGSECTGKTTQSKILYEHLRSLSIPVIWTREIGGTETAEKIRDLMLGNEMHAMTEMFLSMAARYEHVHDLIIPSLSSGITVICDRFIDSTGVYRNIDDNTLECDDYTTRGVCDRLFGQFTPGLPCDKSCGVGVGICCTNGSCLSGVLVSQVDLVGGNLWG